MTGKSDISMSVEGISRPPQSGQSSQPSGASSVAQRVRTGRRPRRRGAPPAWIIAVSRRLNHFRLLLSTRLPGAFRENRQAFYTALGSLLLHVLLAGIMTLFVMDNSYPEQLLAILSVPNSPEPPEELVETDFEVFQPEDLVELDVNSRMKEMLDDLEEQKERETVDSLTDRDLTANLQPLDSDFEKLFRQGEMGGRTQAGRRAAVKLYGGTADSEASVNSGLKWLSGIQQKDGRWDFGEVGEGAQPGAFAATDNGATALALLCFLGAGHTHTNEGPYRDTVSRGLKFLLSETQMTSGGADLRGTAEGNSGMYVQGIAGICLSEAAALSPRDRELKNAAAMAVRFIERAQDPVEGGWRYQPREAGDTSVVGWQLMALQSARSAGVSVSSRTLRDARTFLVSVQFEGGSQYGYRPGRGGPRNSMTAVGLLCRMYLGMKADHPALKAGVEHLLKARPSRNDMYYNYYATQVLHHYGGAAWESWNSRMRPMLVSTQIKEGPAAGSWRVTDPHGGSGGSIYQTALSILTLEIYYRHLPLYRRLDSAKSDTAASGNSDAD